jgi:hypothetical protein
MSFDLAVWEGDRPADNEEAARVLDQLYNDLIASGDRIDPSPRIAAYVDRLLARWPDAGSDAEVDSPWSDGPLLGNASGRLFYFGITYSNRRELLQEAIDYAVALAAERGLVCYDPQYSTLR